MPAPEATSIPQMAKSAPWRPFAEILLEYYRKCESENVEHHVAGKASIMRKAFGEECLMKGMLDGPLSLEAISWNARLDRVEIMMPSTPAQDAQEVVADIGKRDIFPSY